MTGRPLGPRTGSFGLLEQQAHDGVVLPKQSMFGVRKMSLSGAREREKLFPFMCRCLRRRKIGMLILTVFGFFAFVTGLFTVNNEFALESTGFKVGQSLQNTGSFVCGENNSHLPPPNLHASAVPRDNPCKNFAFPPPPSDGRKRTGPRPCPVCYLPVEQAIASMPSSPSISPVLRHLTYFHEENPVKTEPHGGSDFGGYPSLERRNDSYIIKESMTLHCGFIKGCRPGHRTGFDIDEADLRELEEFHEVIVASAIFGNYDIIWQPKNLSETASKHVPFYMFIDEKTEAFMKNSSVLDSSRRVGFWRIIIVHNIPYADARRNGKVPKLLLHRLFPNVRYSIWIDGKLQLVVDPYQILERFLWRHNATFAISRHYRRFDVFEEAEANKAAGKYDNASIDHQIEFYKREGLTPYSVDKFPITSDVPEGCVIIREHIPITNLFACLWFNEVDRFTSRDQLSFSTVRDKIMAKVNWSVNMFMDCERRNFVIQGYHKELIDRMPPPVVQIHRQTALIGNNTAGRIPVKKNPLKNGRASRRSGSRHHCKVAMVVGATF